MKKQNSLTNFFDKEICRKIENDSQHKDNKNDSKITANLVKDSNYEMPCLLLKLYENMRRLGMTG